MDPVVLWRTARLLYRVRDQVLARAGRFATGWGRLPAELNLVLPPPLGRARPTDACRRREHTRQWRRGTEVARVLERFGPGAQISEIADVLDESRTAVKAFLLGRVGRDDERFDRWMHGHDLPRRPQAASAEFSASPLRPLYFDGARIVEWGDLDLASDREVVWRELGMGSVAAHLVLEVERMLDLPCWCDAICYWRVTRLAAIPTTTSTKSYEILRDSPMFRPAPGWPAYIDVVDQVRADPLDYVDRHLRQVRLAVEQRPALSRDLHEQTGEPWLGIWSDWCEAASIAAMGRPPPLVRGSDGEWGFAARLSAGSSCPPCVMLEALNESMYAPHAS